MSDYTAAPVPYDDRIDAAALDVANLARVDAMGKGYATFTRDTLVCTGWWDPHLHCDHSGAGEIQVRVPWYAPDEVDREWSWQSHVRRCRLEVTQAIERYDFEMHETDRAREHAKATRAGRST